MEIDGSSNFGLELDEMELEKIEKFKEENSSDEMDSMIEDIDAEISDNDKL